MFHDYPDCMQLQKVMQLITVAASATSCKTNTKRGGETRRVAGIQPMQPSLSAVCLHHTEPAGTLAFLFLSNLSLHFTPISKPVLVRGGKRRCSEFRPVSEPFRSARLF